MVTYLHTYMTDFNNPEERKQWESDMEFLGRDDKEPMSDKDYEFLESKFGKKYIEDLAVKTYRYGMFQDIIVYLLPEKIGVLYNTVTGQQWLYKGQEELNSMFLTAKNKSQRYNELNRALM
jgi:hypothetical protein